MAEDDDESFGDFSFAPYPPKPTVDAQTNAPNPPLTAIDADNNLEGDEWGHFVDGSQGSNLSEGPSQPDPFAVFSTHGFQHPTPSTRLREQVTSQIKSPETPQWVKPTGALPLSLFGEEEDDEKHVMGVESALIETQFAKEDTNKLSNGSNTGSSIGLNDILADLYNHSPKFQSGNPASNASVSGNPIFNLDSSKLDLTGGSSAREEDSTPVHNLDWNSARSESNSLSVGSISTESGRDLNKFCSEQTGFQSNMSVNVIELSERINSVDGVHGLKIDVCSSDTNAPSYGVWGPDFGGFGSSPKTLNSSFSRLNSNSDTTVACEKSDAKNTNNDCYDDDDDDDGWEFKEACTEGTEMGTKNKAGSEAQEIYGTNTLPVCFNNGLNTPLDLFPVPNSSAEADSLTHYMGDMNTYSNGTDTCSNGVLQTDIKGHDTGTIVPYSYGLESVSNHSADLFSLSNRTDIVLQDTGDMLPLSSKFSNGFLMTNGSVKAKPEEHDAGDLKVNLSWYSGGASSSIGLLTASDASANLFTTTNALTSIMHEYNVDSSTKSSACAQNNFVSDFSLTSERRDSNDDEFGEFTSALSDSASPLEVNMSGSIFEGALPFSVPGIEELDVDVSSPINDSFTCHQIAKKPEPAISINDIIPSFYNQVEHTSSVNSLENLSNVVESPYLGDVSNLVNGEDVLGDEPWEPKGAITQRRAESETCSLDHGEPLPSSLTIRKLDSYVDFYSELKKELCLHSKHNLPNLKGAHKELDYEYSIREGDYLTVHPSWETCFHEFIEVLKKPKFQVLESEYNISRRLSQTENDFSSSVELISHASIMLNLLTLVSVKDQLFYVSIWHTILSVCTRELQHGTNLWKQILDNDAHSQVFSNTRGMKYILGLVEIYKVAVVLEASVKLYQPWTWLSSVDFTGIRSLLDECHALWSSSGLGHAILSSDLESASTIGLCLDNIKFIHDIDAYTLQKRLFSQNDITCGLSLLTSEVLHELGMKLVLWNGEHYFVTLANIWANLISNDPPELPPRLCFAS
ncbi:unnamed protein product [Cuscuta epithymum]|nr:unnamed protein product [Cuscuta epithymum]